MKKKQYIMTLEGMVYRVPIPEWQSRPYWTAQYRTPSGSYISESLALRRREAYVKRFMDTYRRLSREDNEQV